MPLRPLGTVKEILESAEMNISYAYEDLVFLDHNAFFLQFTDKEQEVLIHINEEAVEDEIVQDLALLQKKAEENKMIFSKAGYYRLSQADEENINIEFLGTETKSK
ncbi:MAG TPA: hypothetical protein EYH19_07850 [Desulfocapsa sulfexigens]|nr:hypothetical protein [Desulfocapsa sulfexigens]